MQFSKLASGVSKLSFRSVGYIIFPLSLLKWGRDFNAPAPFSFVVMITYCAYQLPMKLASMSATISHRMMKDWRTLKA